MTGLQCTYANCSDEADTIMVINTGVEMGHEQNDFTAVMLPVCKPHAGGRGAQAVNILCVDGKPPVVTYVNAS